MTNYHQQLDTAWGTTLREFFLITDIKAEIKRRAGRVGWDSNKVEDLEAHLRRIGAIQ